MEYAPELWSSGTESLENFYLCFLSWKTYLGEFINLRVFLNPYLQASVTEQTFVYNHLSTKNIPQSEQNIFF